MSQQRQCRVCDDIVNQEDLLAHAYSHAERGEKPTRMKKHTKVSRGERNNNSKLTEAEVKEIKKLLPTRTYPWLAQKYGVSESAIYQIKTGKAWTWVK